MNFWVCKGRPENAFISVLKPGKIALWHTGRIPKKLSRGDLIFIWESSPFRRLVGLAKVHDSDRGIDKTNGHHLFEQKYLTRRLRSPLEMDELRRIPVLKTASFLKAGPNVLLTPITREQAEILISLLALRNPNDIPKALQPQSANDYALPSIGEAILMAAVEGGKKLAVHFIRERSPALARDKRKAVLAKLGRLACEVCKFDFRDRYGKLGEGFCEVHHKRPLADLDSAIEVRLEDLAIICSNCHRMIHKDGLKTVAALRGKLR
jgi:hypothetical protein